MPNYEEGLKLLTDTITKQIYHVDYKRVNEIAIRNKAMVTGVGIETLLKQFVMREDNKLFAQRVNLTHVITPHICNVIKNPMIKVGRTIPTVSIKWTTTNEKADTNKKDLVDAANAYYGENTLDDYLSNRLADYNQYDPNTFIVTEFNGVYDPTKPDQKPQPYPFHVTSDMAMNYIKLNNILQWLIVNMPIMYKDKDDKDTVGAAYTIYMENENIKATQVDPSKKDSIISNAPDTQFIQVTDANGTIKSLYVISVAEHKAGRLPVVSVGYMQDPVTEYRTNISILEPAIAYLMKSIKTMSEFDLTNTLHTFPQKIVYADPCQGYRDENKVLQQCLGGYLMNGTKCRECDGLGVKVHKTTADVIYMSIPKDKAEMIDLEKLVVYKQPDPNFLTFQKEMAFYDLTVGAIKAVYNSDLFVSDSTATTATEKIIDLDSVYDTLVPYARKWSSVWKIIMQLIATYRSYGEGLELVHKFPRDLKMKTYSQLIDDLGKATTNNAPSYVRRAIVHDIARLIYIDDPNEILKIKTKEKFYPFEGKSDADIQFIIAGDYLDDRTRTLWIFFDTIFIEIENEQASQDTPTDFYQMTYDKQLAIINKKLDEKVASLSVNQVDPISGKSATTIEGGAPTFAVGDQVAIIPGSASETPPIKAGQKLIIYEISGGTYSVQLPDGFIQKGIPGTDLQSFN